MRVVIYGSRTFGSLVLSDLLDRGADVALAVSPAWRDDADLPAYADGQHRDRLRAVAEDAGIPWRAARTVPADQVPRCDVIIAAHSHDFIGRRTRSAARFGAIGYHPSLLPRHRGRDAVRWTIRSGDPVAGGSVYWLTDTVDGGPIAAQDWCWVTPGWTASDLWRRALLPMGLRLIGAALDDIDAGVIRREPQREDVATWEPALDSQPLHRPELPELEAPGVAANRGYVVVPAASNGRS